MRDRKGKAVEVRKPPVGAFIIASIVYIILGVFMVTHPAKVEATLCYAFGILMTIFGVINVISFFINKTHFVGTKSRNRMTAAYI